MINGYYVLGVRKDGTPPIKRVRHRYWDGSYRDRLKPMPAIIPLERWQCGTYGSYGYIESVKLTDDYDIIKVYYESDTWRVTVADIEIGYMECRTSPLQRLRARLWSTVGDVPF